jgi:hypothetical protein
MENEDAKRRELLRVDYEQTLAYFRSLHEVRFKLLGFLPILTGAAVVSSSGTTPTQRLALACFGFLATLGLTSYDQRNTQIYDRLVRRARLLEKELGFIPLPGDRVGGAFHCRPPIQKVLGIMLVWHIQGLTLVYAASLTAWFWLGALAIISKPGIVVGSTIAAFIAIYFALRIISSIHHRATQEMKKQMEPPTGASTAQ